VKFLDFLKTTAKKLGDGTDTLLVPNLKVGRPFFLGPYGCCAYGRRPLTHYISSITITTENAQTIKMNKVTMQVTKLHRT